MLPSRIDPQEWLKAFFEFEYCDECGGDADDHEVCIVPGTGTYFARCLRSPHEDVPLIHYPQPPKETD